MCIRISGGRVFHRHAYLLEKKTALANVIPIEDTFLNYKNYF